MKNSDSAIAPEETTICRRRIVKYADWSEYCMRLLSCTDADGKFKLLQGGKKSFDNKTVKLWENIDNWRKGKHTPLDSTIDAMRNGDFGDAGIFTSAVNDAVRKKDIERFTEILNKDLDQVYGGLDYGLAIIHDMDDKISELCFVDEDNKPHDAYPLYAVWNTVAHAVWTMDKAKEMLNIDFRVLAKSYYKDFAVSPSS